MNPSSHACLWKCYNLVKQRSVCIFDHCTGFLPISFHTHFIILLPFLSQICLILPPPLLQLSLPLLSLLILILTNCHISNRSYLPLLWSSFISFVRMIPKCLLDTSTWMPSCPLPTKSKIKPITFPSCSRCSSCLTGLSARLPPFRLSPQGPFCAVPSLHSHIH